MKHLIFFVVSIDDDIVLLRSLLPPLGFSRLLSVGFKGMCNLVFFITLIFSKQSVRLPLVMVWLLSFSLTLSLILPHALSLSHSLALILSLSREHTVV